METEELVRAAQAGDRAAMEQLLRTWRPILVRCAAAMVRDEDAAQDIVQETLVKVVRNIDQLASPAAFAGWAQQILRRNGIEHFRSESRCMRRSYGNDDPELLARIADDAGSFDAGDEMEEGLRRLRTDDRALLELHYWGGFELAEIAAMFGIATGATKTRLFRARGRLGTALSVS